MSATLQTISEATVLTHYSQIGDFWGVYAYSWYSRLLHAHSNCCRQPFAHTSVLPITMHRSSSRSFCHAALCVSIPIHTCVITLSGNVPYRQVITAFIIRCRAPCQMWAINTCHVCLSRVHQCYSQSDRYLMWDNFSTRLWLVSVISSCY